MTSQVFEYDIIYLYSSSIETYELMMAH